MSPDKAEDCRQWVRDRIEAAGLTDEIQAEAVAVAELRREMETL